ncbi:MAG: hypothetical protein COZ18_10075 [Flexibacter sp. CG_4_10_14_3_um_filter_32_15]|nr:MAG: hypothetical protein COZ18_10075 [Flexibacter sp. CG_4_10_14_3_um_filter_32_15]
MTRFAIILFLFLCSCFSINAQSIELDYDGKKTVVFENINVLPNHIVQTNTYFNSEYIEVVFKVTSLEIGKYELVFKPNFDDEIAMEGDYFCYVTSDIDDMMPFKEGFIEITSSNNGLVSGSFQGKSPQGQTFKGTFKDIKIEN